MIAIGKTGMVESFDVSLSSHLSFPDEARTAAERNVETLYHSCLTNHVIV